ncbi:Hexose carrier protein HEX6 [Spatholobus suberectus]|nr:Hexose carrier protein HEX6 [Spatholobus suberectus]
MPKVDSSRFNDDSIDAYGIPVKKATFKISGKTETDYSNDNNADSIDAYKSRKAALCVVGPQSVPLFLSEMAPPRYRGTINNGFQLCVGIGVLSANLINFGTEKIRGGWDWRISLVMAAVPASMLTLGSFLLPETPNSIIQRSKDHHKAKVMLQRIRGTGDVQSELEDLIEASNMSNSIKHPFKNILQSKYRPQLVMVLAIPFFQQFTGINVISFYAPILFLTVGLGESVLFLSAVMNGMTAFVYLLLPETKNVPIERMDTVWKEHIFWKRIVGDELRHKDIAVP